MRIKSIGKGKYTGYAIGAVAGAAAILVYEHVMNNYLSQSFYGHKGGKSKGKGKGKMKGHNASKGSKGMRGQHMAMMKGGGGAMMNQNQMMPMDMQMQMMDQAQMMPVAMDQNQVQMMQPVPQTQIQPMVMSQVPPIGPCVFDMTANQFVFQGTLQPCTPSQDPNAQSMGVPLTTNPAGIASGFMPATQSMFAGEREMSLLAQDDEDLYDMFGHADRGHVYANTHIGKNVSPYDEDSHTMPYPKPIQWYNYVARPSNLH